MSNKQRCKAVNADERYNLTGKIKVNRLFQMRMSEWLLHSVHLKNKNATRNNQEGCSTFTKVER